MEKVFFLVIFNIHHTKFTAIRVPNHGAMGVVVNGVLDGNRNTFVYERANWISSWLSPMSAFPVPFSRDHKHWCSQGQGLPIRPNRPNRIAKYPLVTRT